MKKKYVYGIDVSEYDFCRNNVQEFIKGLRVSFWGKPEYEVPKDHEPVTIIDGISEDDFNNNNYNE